MTRRSKISWLYRPRIIAKEARISNGLEFVSNSDRKLSSFAIPAAPDAATKYAIKMQARIFAAGAAMGNRSGHNHLADVVALIRLRTGSGGGSASYRLIAGHDPISVQA